VAYVNPESTANNYKESALDFRDFRSITRDCWILIRAIDDNLCLSLSVDRAILFRSSIADSPSGSGPLILMVQRTATGKSIPIVFSA